MLPSNIIEKISLGYDKLWEAFIKPQKIDYSEEMLGPKMRNYGDLTYIRDDFDVINDSNERIKVSLRYPLPTREIDRVSGNFFEHHKYTKKRDLNLIPTVVYLHSQGGNRLEGLFLEEFCSENGYALCLLDFLGCGLSDGEYVSLGVSESTQVELVLNQVRTWHNIGPVALWGRSMGAVTSVVYAERNSFEIAALVLDSPFGSIREMVCDIAYRDYNVPEFVVSMGLVVISGSIEKRIGVDLFKFEPIKHGLRSSAPALFIVGEDDGLVKPERVSQMYAAYGSKNSGVRKDFIISKGQHNDCREETVLASGMDFVQRAFRGASKHLTNAVNLMKPHTCRLLSVHNPKIGLSGHIHALQDAQRANLADQVYSLRSRFIQGVQVPQRSAEGMARPRDASQLNITTKNSRERDRSQKCTPQNSRGLQRANTIQLSRKPSQNSGPQTYKRTGSGLAKGQFDESTQDSHPVDDTLDLDAFDVERDALVNITDKYESNRDSMIGDIQILDTYLKNHPLHHNRAKR